MFRLDCGHVDVDVVLQRLDVLTDVHLGTVNEEVYVDEVICTPCTEMDKVLEVGQASLTSTIGDCGSTELDCTIVGLHKSFVDCNTLGWCEISFRWVVRFVRAVHLVSKKREALLNVENNYANIALVPPSIKIGTVSFQSLFSSLASTTMVGTYENQVLSSSPRMTSPLVPYVT